MSGTTSSSHATGDLFFQPMLLSQELLTDILNQINDISAFEPDREFLWNRQLTKLTSDVGLFVELTTLLSKLLMNKRKLALPRVKNSHIHLLFILKAMNQAQLKSDTVILEELIKYELKDNLTQWKIDLIPQTKRLINS